MDLSGAPESIEQHVELLDTPECWRLIRTVDYGRLAVVAHDGPDLFPLNVVDDHGTIVFRTGSGTILRRIEDDPRVAFEFDSVDAGAGTAWSVVLRGRAEVIRDAHEAVTALELGIAPWAAGVKNWLVRLVPASITGRRFAIVDPSVWEPDTPHQPLPSELE